MIEVSCVKGGVAYTEDGQVLPVTNWLDEDGDDCDEDDAVVCVAGPDRDGFWLTIDFREMEEVTLQ